MKSFQKQNTFVSSKKSNENAFRVAKFDTAFVVASVLSHINSSQQIFLLKRKKKPLRNSNFNTVWSTTRTSDTYLHEKCPLAAAKSHW